MDENKVKKIVNGSGFPLQIGIQSLVEGSYERHGWRVLFSEHSWVNYETEENGFIDLLLMDKKQKIILNIECKRVKNGKWYFLQSESKLKNRRHAKTHYLHANFGKPKYWGWKDVALEPSTIEAEFCVIGGEDSKASRSMLEKTAANVVQSTEGFSIEDHSYSHKLEDFERLYFNVIVTTADLFVCNFDPQQINIETGEIDKTNTTEVPYIRFRKQFSTHTTPELSWTETYNSEISRNKENTVFVVNSKNIVQFLKEFELDGS